MVPTLKMSEKSIYAKSSFCLYSPALISSPYGAR